MDKKKLHEFLMQSASGTIGTIVGIILTFGTTIFLERREQKQMERKEALWVIYDIDEFCKGVGKDLELYKKINSVNMLVWANRKNLDQLPADTLNFFLDNLYTTYFLSRDNTVENIFTTNIDTWKNIDNQNFVRLAGYCFSVKKELREVFWQLNKEYYNLNCKVVLMYSYSFYQFKSTYEFIEQVIKSEEFRSLIGKLEYIVSASEQMVADMEEANAKNKKLMHVTDEDLSKMFGNIESDTNI